MKHRWDLVGKGQRSRLAGHSRRLNNGGFDALVNGCGVDDVAPGEAGAPVYNLLWVDAGLRQRIVEGVVVIGLLQRGVGLLPGSAAAISPVAIVIQKNRVSGLVKSGRELGETEMAYAGQLVPISTLLQGLTDGSSVIYSLHGS